MDFFAEAYANKRASSPKPHSSRNQQGGVGYGCEANAHLRRASIGLEDEYGQSNPRDFASSYCSYSSSSPAWMKERQPKYAARQGARGEVDHPNDRDSTPTNYTSAAHNATDRRPASPNTSLHPGSIRHPLYRRTSLTNPCLMHHTSTGGAVRPPMMPKSASTGFLQDLPRQDVDHHSHPRFFSNTDPSTVNEQEATF
ncbi:hypothetical protein BGZ93_008533 [Podila epicladia]|nr:hypothetical protein BGZ92_002536 [Podila epicladia]KAG0092021.1 hypothetical protein BGZ93_008533 [Podila epicladia]